MTQFIHNPQIIAYVILPVLIFSARVCDVTLGTIRVICVAKGRKIYASLLGFGEVLIWITVIAQIMKNLDNPICYLAYAAGFAMGNFIGITIEEKLAIGSLVVRIITNSDATSLIYSLKTAGFGVTVLDAHGANGPVHVIYTVIKRCALPEVDQIIKRFNPNTFYSIEELRAVHAGVFPYENRYFSGIRYLNSLRNRALRR
ncbi:MAG: DUF2179 domain-containing protein [Firmicutes bacterium]|nr:DUF2179 domain-containing protein [Bacillota bacterium]